MFTHSCVTARQTLLWNLKAKDDDDKQSLGMMWWVWLSSLRCTVDRHFLFYFFFLSRLARTYPHYALTYVCTQHFERGNIWWRRCNVFRLCRKRNFFCPPVKIFSFRPDLAFRLLSMAGRLRGRKWSSNYSGTFLLPNKKGGFVRFVALIYFSSVGLIADFPVPYMTHVDVVEAGLESLDADVLGVASTIESARFMNNRIGHIDNDAFR